MPANERSRELILQAGVGVANLRIGESRVKDIQRELGAPIHVMRTTNARNYIHGGGLIFNVPEDRPINTIITRGSFAGRTAAGIRHGDSRDQVIKLYGQPAPSRARRTSITYEAGIVFYFDSQGLVNRIVLGRVARLDTRVRLPNSAGRE